ncbi:hypothetical protein FACS1894199_06940 [Bacteroidia bacterium]|nr:hypothetical protein FACS1894199_06940 [Bacteroidia bacterium]
MKHTYLLFSWTIFRLLVFSACICTLGIVTSCEDKEDDVVKHNPSIAMTLTSFTPDSGRISEMVLLDGTNFGKDTALLKVFFNAKQASVIGSTGTRLLVIVPRLPGDTCTITVQVGDQVAAYSEKFIYKVEASVTTLAGKGHDYPGPVYTSLDQAEFWPTFLAVDKDFNIFMTDWTTGSLLKLNVQENSIQVLGTPQQGIDMRCVISVHPITQVVMLGDMGQATRDQFVFLDPKNNWAPKLHFIKSWDANGFDMPIDVGADDYANHIQCLYCEADEHLYTRYYSGQIVQINPKTWAAKIVAQTPEGLSNGMSFYPNTTMLWMGFEKGTLAGSICRIDVTDPGSLEEMSTPIGGGGHRDGPLAIAQFYGPRQLSFDEDNNLIICEAYNRDIRMLNTSTMMVSTIIGIPGVLGNQDGPKETATFWEPNYIAIDAEGIMYIADFGNKNIRRVAIE